MTITELAAWARTVPADAIRLGDLPAEGERVTWGGVVSPPAATLFAEGHDMRPDAFCFLTDGAVVVQAAGERHVLPVREGATLADGLHVVAEFLAPAWGPVIAFTVNEEPPNEERHESGWGSEVWCGELVDVAEISATASDLPVGGRVEFRGEFGLRTTVEDRLPEPLLYAVMLRLRGDGCWEVSNSPARTVRQFCERRTASGFGSLGEVIAWSEAVFNAAIDPDEPAPWGHSYPWHVQHVWPFYLAAPEQEPRELRVLLA